MMALAILGQEDGSLPTWRVDKENWVVWEYIWRFGGSDGGTQGPIGLIMAWMKWIEKRNGAIGNFRAGQWVFTDAENDDKNCSFSPLTIVLTNPNFAWKMKKMKNKKHHLLLNSTKKKLMFLKMLNFHFCGKIWVRCLSNLYFYYFIGVTLKHILSYFFTLKAFCFGWKGQGTIDTVNGKVERVCI